MNEDTIRTMFEDMLLKRRDLWDVYSVPLGEPCLLMQCGFSNSLVRDSFGNYFDPEIRAAFVGYRAALL